MDYVSSKWKGWASWYDRIWEFRDKRMDGYPLMSSPLYTVLLCAIYVYVVKMAGPRFMKDRPPLNIKTFMVVYNAFQVFLSGYIFVQVDMILKYF